MNVYPVTFTMPDGTVVQGELVAAVSLSTFDWNLQRASDGSGYSGFPQGNPPIGPALTASQSVPNFTGETQALSQPFVGIGGVFNLTSGVTGVLNGAGVNGSTLPTGWSWNGVNLSYDGVTVNGSPLTGLSVTGTRTADGSTATTNTFAIQGAGGATDTFPPTIPTSASITLNGSFEPVITCDAQMDPSPPPANSNDFTGVAGYPITRGGSALTTVATGAGTGQYRDQLVSADIGSPAVAGNTTQSGSTLTMSAGGLDFFGTSDQGQVCYNPVPFTGSFTRTCRVDALTGPQEFSKSGIFCSAGITPSEPRVCLVATPPSLGGGLQLTVRTAAGGATTVVVNIPGNYATPEFIRLAGVYSSGSWSFSVLTSPDGENWSTGGTATGISGIPAQAISGYMGSAHQATGQMQSTLSQCAFTQDPQVSFTDTSISQGANAQNLSYTIACKDNAGNVSSAVSLAITVPGNVPVPGIQVVGNRIYELATGLPWATTGQSGQGGDITGSEISYANAMWDAYFLFTPAQAQAMKTLQKIDHMRVNYNEWAWRTNALSAGGRPYQTIMNTYVATLRGAGIYVIKDLHWAAPAGYTASSGQGGGGQNIAGYADGQPGFLNSDYSIKFWQDQADLSKNDPGIAFELLNEPLANGTGSPWNAAQLQMLLDNTAGLTTTFTNQYQGKTIVQTGVTYTPVGYQQVLNAIRARGAPNVILTGCPVLSSYPAQSLAVKPTDTVAPAGFVGTWTPQVVCVVHYANGSDSDYTNIQNAGVPVWMTEFYTLAGRGSGANTGYAWAKLNGIPYVQWGADNWDGTSSSSLAGSAPPGPCVTIAGTQASGGFNGSGYFWHFHRTGSGNNGPAVPMLGVPSSP